MASFDKPHIDISARVYKRRYQAPRRNMGGGSAPRIREEHGARILEEMRASFREADDTRPEDDRVGRPDGVFVEVDLRRGASPESVLERKRDKVLAGASQKLENDETRVALFVPDEARPILESIIQDYTSGALNAKDQPPRKDKVEPIEAVRQARLETFWTDEPQRLPSSDDDPIWWELWCFKGMQARVIEAAASLGCELSEEQHWLSFPESTVLQMLADRVTVELLLFATTAVSELRRATATPVFFLDEEPEEQIQWTENLAERTVWPPGDAPAVCLIDTGVNRAHMLIEPALSSDDLLSIDQEWGSTDHHGHGTGMAGLSLFGDLFPRLQDESEITLNFRLESVKVLPPNGFPANDPQSYGSITQSATSIAEINKPNRKRVFCLAVTNENVSGSRATTWSAAIDQAAVGKMPGDDEGSPKRLFVVSAGNIPAEIEMANVITPDDAPIEDPAQAWNSLTVGGYTQKTLISEAGYEDWSPMVSAGQLSPFSRTSVTWPQGKSPFKPDVVMEAGNRAISPDENEALSLDSLALLTTGDDTAQHPLVPFAATSAAAAQAAKLASEIHASDPELWPETVRALIVHSAEYTQSMRLELDAVPSMTARYSILRRFGHGVPSYQRAIASANNHLALVAQNEISPFQVVSGQKKFGDCHFYKLPWPGELLEELGEQDIRLKVSLSYFVEPNPGRFASIDAQRYQSFGLRFDLKRPTEPEGDFIERNNALEREDPLGSGPAAVDNSGWRFGPKSISAGSLHCDEWIGPAVQLAARNTLCVKPVTGWWRDSVANARKSARYALVVTISAPNIDIDLHTPIQTIVENEVGIEITF